MIVNGVVESVEAMRSPLLKQMKSLEVDLKITDIAQVGDNLEVNFAYEAKYEEDMGYVRMNGRLLVAPPSKDAMKEVVELWKKDKTTPIGFSQEVVDSAYHMCTVNSVLATKIIDLSPPIPPLKIDLAKGIENSQKMNKSKKSKS